MTKKEQEIYAALVLIKTGQVSEPFSIDWAKDKPDLQIKDFGIEVVRAIDKKEAEQDKLDSKILKCENYDSAKEYINNLKYPESYRSTPRQLPNSNRFSLVSGGGYDGEKHIELIKSTICRKSMKYLEYPNHQMYTRRGLYVFDDELRPCIQYLPFDSIIEAIISSVFDVMFIHQINKMIIFEKNATCPHEIQLEGNIMLDIKCEVKRICKSPDYEVFCERVKSYNKSRHF